MRKPFFGLEMDLNAIAEKPGNTVEELRGQVQTLARTLRGVVEFLNNDIANHVVEELERTKRFSS